MILKINMDLAKKSSIWLDTLFYSDRFKI